MTVDPALARVVRSLAGAEQLVVGSDLDGTLAPIAPDPASARVLPGVVDVLNSLAALPSTTVVVLSGRPLRELRVLLHGASGVVLVGSHGAEWDGGPAPLDAGQEALRARLVHESLRISRGLPGVRVERKPVGVALHVRSAPRDVASHLLAQALAGPAAWDGVRVLEGKEVLELTVVDADKGEAFADLVEEHDATRALFVGDDATDEHVFARARPDDVTIKVGPGPTAAHHRVDDPVDVVHLLSLLALERAPR